MTTSAPAGPHRIPADVIAHEPDPGCVCAPVRDDGGTWQHTALQTPAPPAQPPLPLWVAALAATAALLALVTAGFAIGWYLI